MEEHRSTDRDPEIAAALASRQVPPSREGFFDDLATALAAEAPASAATARPAPLRTRRPRRMVAWAAPAIAAGVAAILATTNLLPSSHHARQVVAPPSTAATSPTSAAPPTSELHATLVAEVIQRASTALQSLHSLSAVIETKSFSVTDQQGEKTETGPASTTHLRADAKGRLWTSTVQSGETVVSSYDPASGEERSCSVTTKPTCIVTAGEADDVRFSRFGKLYVFVPIVRAAAAADDPRLSEVTYDGRPAWQLDVATSLDLFGFGADHWTVTVDKATSFPVRLHGTYRGQDIDDIAVHDLVIDPSLSAADLTVAIPSGAAVERTDEGYRRVPLEGVAAVVGYEPIVPSTLPAGFELTTVTVNKDAGPGGPEGMNANNRNVVELTYRRGLQAIVVTTRASANGGQEWNDPYAYEGEPPHKKDLVKLSTGRFSGLTADVVATSTSTPHLWVVGAHWVLTVAGDAARDELLAVAGSLQQAGAPAS